MSALLQTMKSDEMENLHRDLSSHNMSDLPLFSPKFRQALSLKLISMMIVVDDNHVSVNCADGRFWNRTRQAVLS